MDTGYPGSYITLKFSILSNVFPLSFLSFLFLNVNSIFFYSSNIHPTPILIPIPQVTELV